MRAELPRFWLCVTLTSTDTEPESDPFIQSWHSPCLVPTLSRSPAGWSAASPARWRRFCPWVGIAS